jgi:hypothetical protein
VIQKSLTKKSTLRANAGILFAGNTVFGIGGRRKVNGRLFSGGVSLIRQFTDRLLLGGEIYGVAAAILIWATASCKRRLAAITI